MKKILLINPPVYDFKLYDEWMNPLGLLFLSSILKQAGFEVIFKDYLYSRDSKRTYGRGFFKREEYDIPQDLSIMNKKYYRFGISEKEMIEDIKKLDYDLVLVGSFLTYWYQGSFEMIRILKSLHPDKPVFLGGSYATLCREHALKSGADEVISGNFNDESLKKIGKVLNTPIFKKWEEYDQYIDIQSVMDKPFLSLTLCLGCPYSCSYCASKILQPEFKLLHFPPIADFHEAYQKGIRNIAFFDDALLYCFDNLKEQVEKLNAKGLFFNYHTPNGLHIGMIDEEKALFLKNNRFKTLRFGLEAFDQTIQTNSFYKATQEKIVEGINALKEAGFQKMEIGFYLLISPFVQKEKIEETVEFLKSQRVNIHFNLFSPIPGTPDFQKLEKIYPEIKNEPLFHNDSVFMYKYPFFEPEWIQEMKRKIRGYNSVMS
ncbi:MAG TPA: hypothetical protein DHW82_14520 [Spirochaetia bacterium]|nr:MAG: hypothetical protein A2Y41_05790 [Spirochaetes bacterium GWB1_36_13]HCL58202.1 hypothetical protein [Spirochaetia bacterium]